MREPGELAHDGEGAEKSPDAALRPGPVDPALAGRITDHYEALRELARQTVRGKRGEELLDPTELVHEGFMRLARHAAGTPERRTEFMALAATVLRNVLVDHARERQALKRGGHLHRLTLDGRNLTEGQGIDLLELDEALRKLARLDERQARIVELKFFGGLSNDEAARLVGVCTRTLDGEWKLARAWLRRELAG